jgi:hypothetical protein
MGIMYSSYVEFPTQKVQNGWEIMYNIKDGQSPGELASERSFFPVFVIARTPANSMASLRFLNETTEMPTGYWPPSARTDTGYYV